MQGLSTQSYQWNLLEDPKICKCAVRSASHSILSTGLQNTATSARTEMLCASNCAL